MNTVFAKDDKYEHHNNEEYHLSILLDDSAYSFAVLNIVWNKYVAQKKVFFKDEKQSDGAKMLPQSLFRSEDYFLKQYKSVSIIYSSRYATLVPKRYFEAERATDYLVLNHDLPLDTEVLLNFIPKINAYNIFGINKELKEAIAAKFPNARVYHQATPMISNALHLPISDTEDTVNVTVNFNYRFIDVVVSSNEKLLLYNSFEIETENDCLYYILFVIKQLNLDPERIKLYLYGQVNATSDLNNKLQQTIRHIYYAAPTTSFCYSNKLDVFPKHEYVNLYNLYTCE